MTAAPPPVFPVPRRVDHHGGHGSLDVISTTTDPSLPGHGYRLRIGADGTAVEHRDDAGLRHAHDTVGQLRAAGDERAGIVEDWPAFTERAYMLDVSRDRVPTMETFEWLIILLARLRFTGLLLYTEHTFAFADHEEVWRHASPLTRDELAHLAGRCAELGLELVPCLNGFGHMERFLRHDTYRHRAECPDGAPALIGDGIAPPTTLAPGPANAEFALSLFREVIDAVPSMRVHVGGDEPFELGHGRSADDVARRGKAAVYAEHLARIIGPLVDDGHDVLFWGDVLARAPEQVRTLPTGSTAVAWWYAPPVASPPPIADVLGATLAERLNLPDDALAGFIAHTRVYAETGFPFWVAPGTSSWNSFIGRWPDARANIDDAVTVGLDRGARGLLLTDWGDNGHHQPLAVSLAPLVHAAGATWCPDTHDAEVVPAVIDRIVAPDGATGPTAAGSSGLGSLLVDLGSVDAGLGVRQFNASAVHAALLGQFVAPRRVGIDAERVAAALDVLDRGSHADFGDDPRLCIVAAEVRAATRLARHGLWHLAIRYGIPVDLPAGGVDAELAETIDAQRSAWAGSSRPGGLHDSIARLRSP